MICIKPAKILNYILLTGIFMLAAWGNLAIANGELEVHDAWVREAPPTATVMAAYLTLHNHGDKTYTLQKASSPAFRQIEIHRTEMKDGMASMKPVSRMMLSPGGAMNFAPGGLHLMLINPLTPLKNGDRVSITLQFTDHSELSFTAPVQKSGSQNHNESTMPSAPQHDHTAH